MTSAHGGDGTRAPRAAVTPLRSGRCDAQGGGARFGGAARRCRGGGRGGALSDQPSALPEMTSRRRVVARA